MYNQYDFNGQIRQIVPLHHHAILPHNITIIIIII